jgi:hypothetical protein
VLLSPYPPDFNLIEEYFRVLKKFIKKKWCGNEDFLEADSTVVWQLAEKDSKKEWVNMAGFWHYLCFLA